ncbi:MAG: hypothetical protein J6C86_02990 [Bacteroidaceae bacterium]|nr:hypothetical protein [Bacteroidaceae bacterium]
MYIYSGSFAYNGKDSDCDVIERMSKFTDLTNKVGEGFRDDNQFYANYTELNETAIFSDGTTFCKLLYGNATGKSFELEQTFYLIMSQGYLEATDISGNTIDSLIVQQTETECNAKVVLSKENAYKEGNCVVATYDDWLSYRSFLLGKFPGTYDLFYSECKRYYRNLVFSKDYQIDSKQVLTTHSIQICHILHCMNIYMIQELNKYKGSRIEFPAVFARNHNIEDASFEGNGDTKRKYLTMNFPDGKRICEAHFKYNHINGKKIFNDVRDCCRVYFAVPTIGDTHIYIGAILNHTKQCN